MATGRLAGQTLTGLAWGPWLRVPNTCSLGKRMFILAHGISVLSTVAGKTRQRESEATVTFRFIHSRETEMNLGTQLSFSLSILSGTAAHGIALSAFRVDQM